MKHKIALMLVLFAFGGMGPAYAAVTSQSNTTPEARVERATYLNGKKDYQGMILLLADAKDKIGRKGLLLLAHAYGKAGRANDAVVTLELANARYPKDVELQTLYAKAFALAGKKEAAIDMYYKARETNPKYIPAYDGLLDQLVKTDSRQEARDLISDMEKRFGMKPRWATELCHLYVLDAYHEKAVEACNRAMTLDSKNPANPVSLAATYREQNNPDKAKDVLIKAAIRIRKSEPIQTALGDYFNERKNFIDAYNWYRAAVKTDPKSFNAQLGLAQAALELQKMDESLAAFTAACKMKRTAIREFQSGLIRVRNRGDVKWQSLFENSIANNCISSF